MIMEPKDNAFRRWLNIPIIIWEYDWMPRERKHTYANEQVYTLDS